MHMFDYILKKAKEMGLVSANDYDDLVRETQKIRLIESSDFNNVVSILMAITWVVHIWGDLPSVVLLTWLMFMVSIFLASTIIQKFSLYKRDYAYLAVKVTKRWYLILVILSAMEIQVRFLI